MGGDGHLLAVDMVSPDGSVDGAAVLAEVAEGEALVSAGEAVVGKLGRESQVCRVIFGGDNEAAGVAVNAVDDAGALFPAYTAQRVAAVVEQRVHQCPIGVTGGGMHH